MTSAPYQPNKPEYRPSEAVRAPVSSEHKLLVQCSDMRALLHRRAAEIHSRLRLIRSGLIHNRDRLLLNYIVDATIGYGKDSDQIANSQFMNGKRCRKTGQVIDWGCGLKSIHTIRKARKSLVGQGVVFETSEQDERGARSANRYGLVFIHDLLELRKLKKKVGTLEQYTPTQYQTLPPTIQSPSEITKPRCTTKQKQKSKRKHFMHPDHVDYLRDQMVKATGDGKEISKRTFAKLALTIPEGKLMELISIIKDRGNIENKGAWLVATASRYTARRVIRADDPEPAAQASEVLRENEASKASREVWLKNREALADKLGISSKGNVTNHHHSDIQNRQLAEMRPT